MSFYEALEQDRLSMPVSERDHIRGRMDAPATLVEYGDYECPACGAAFPLTEAPIDALGDDLRFVYRHFPLINVHPHAQRAAEAAEAAGAQNHYWGMHATLFRNQDTLEDEDLVRHATALNLNAKRFIEDLSQEAYADKIRGDFRSGAHSGVNGTPTFFINGLRYDGPRDVESMAVALSSGGEH